MKIQLLPTPHCAYGSQVKCCCLLNISVASRQISDAVFSYTAEVDGDLFYNRKQTTGNKHHPLIM